MSLAYRSPLDRAYGLAGMTISLASLDALANIVSVSLDTDGPMVAFCNSYYYGYSQSASPKAQWVRLLQNYRIAASLVIGNILSRCLVQPAGTPGIHADPSDMLNEAYRDIAADGRDICQLDVDEIRAFYRDILQSQYRIFSNTRLHPALRSLVATLQEQRTLTGRELAEEMMALHII